MGSVQDIKTKFERWVRLVILLQEGGDSVCKRIIHTEMTVPRQGNEMYKFFKRYETEINKSNMPKYEKEKILPKNECIDTGKLDIPMMTRIIQIFDKTVKYKSISKLRDKRNDLLHMGEDRRDMSEQEFSDHWNEVSLLLASLNCDMSLLNNLKSINLTQNQDYDGTLADILKGSVENIIFCDNIYFTFKST